MKRFVYGLAASVMLTAGVALAPAFAETVLRIGEGDTGELDPHEAGIVADAILMYNVYDTLVYPAMDGKSNEIKPHLAERIDVDATGTVYTVKLKPNVKFHSGNTMSADDVVFSMNRMLALKTGFSYLFDGWVKSGEAKDPLTAVITLNKPFATFYASLSRLSIVDAKTVMANKKEGKYGEFGDYGVAWLNDNGAGTGAYSVVFHKKDERTELKKNANYFLGVSSKAPDVVRLAYGQKDPTVIALFQRGEMDMVRSFVASETKKQLLSMPGVTIANEPGIAMFFMKPNTTKAPFDDVNCRKAFGYALDYEAMMSQEHVTDTIKGAIPAKGPMPSSHAGFDPTMPDIKRDMAKAKEFLAKCKYKPGSHKIQITWINTVAKEERFALVAQHNWKELGFDSEIEPRVWAHWTQEVAKPETTPMIGQVYTFARIPDPDAYLYNIFHSSRHGQFSASEYFSDKEVDAMLEKGRSMPQGAEREALYKQLMNRLEELKATYTGFELINTYPKRDSFVWPNLEKPNMNTGLMGGNHIFRLMEMKGTS